MKKAKTAAAAAKTKVGKRSTGNSPDKKSSGANVDTSGATGKVRSHAGKGLTNEGTNVSYEDEERNG